MKTSTVHFAATKFANRILRIKIILKIKIIHKTFIYTYIICYKIYLF